MANSFPKETFRLWLAAIFPNLFLPDCLNQQASSGSTLATIAYWIPQKYSQHFVLNFLQYEHLKKDSHLVKIKRNKHGKIIRKYVTKKSILNELGHITKDFLAEFTKKHPEIFKKFKIETKTQVRDISNEELTSDLLTKIINYLI